MCYIRFLAILFIPFLVVQFAYSQSRDGVKKSTDVLVFITPVAGFAATLALKDYEGTKQIVLSGATCIASTYLLKYITKKERPDHDGNRSFPSSHTSVAFQGASFIQKRYGWKYGIPAYAISAYVGWGRVYAKRHDWWDVLAGATIGTVSSYIFTRPFAKNHNIALSPAIINNKYPGIYASVKF